MRICVVGAGAIGGWVAARLALAGNDVALLARGETLRRIASEGLTLSEGGQSRRATVAVASDPASLAVPDVLILAVKAQALPELAPGLKPLIGAETIVVPMLNGVPWWFTDEPLAAVDPGGAIARAIPADRLVGCVIHASCLRTEPNQILVRHAERLILGEPGGGASDRVTRLCALFTASGIACDPSGEVRRAVWYKLWGNATINPLSALARATADRLLDDPAIRGWMAAAMDELAAIGAKIGCPIEQTAEDRMAVTARLGAFKSSMLQDVEAERSIELDALVGAPIEIARRHGVATPELDRIHALTRLMAENLGLA